MIKRKKVTYVLLFIFLFILGIFFLYERKTEKFSQIENNEKIELAIYLNDEETNTIPTKDSGYYLDLEKSSCTNNAIIQFDTNTWSPVIKNMSEYKTRCELHFGSTYKESILNGTDPVLEDPLIPVTIDNDGVVRKASLANEWYSYEKKNWANAVILFDENETYEDGEVIPEEKIESYFVWIPKYRYQLWDLGRYDSLTSIDTSKVHEIPIIFGDYNTNDDVDGECTTPMTSGATGNCAVGDYITHPAFISIPSTGFWVGKFETGTTLTSDYNVRNGDAIQIKSNVSSWRNIQLANMFYTSYDYKRDLDSHMMKNTEWGAVAYLQHSAYGSAISVRMNSNSAFITGYQANNEPTCGSTGTNDECNHFCNDGTCNTAYPNSTLASTTGNITGIYDMSGGAWEHVMGVIQDENGSPMSGENLNTNSGFSGLNTDGSFTNGLELPNEKYYDQYLLSNSTDYQRRILGDATGEMGPIARLANSNLVHSWYNDNAWFSANNDPWFARGSQYSSGFETGMFSYGAEAGGVADHISFRIVLTP